MLTLVAVLALAAGPWSAPRTLAFGQDRVWTLYEVQSGKRDRVLLPDVPVDGLDVTKDGSALTWVSKSSEQYQLKLWRWKTESKPEVRLSAKFLSAPRFSEDGKFILFAHHANGNLPGKHEAKAYAQLQRLEVAEHERSPQQLTQSEGCHLGAVSSGPQMFFMHTNCTGVRWVSSSLVGDLTGEERRLWFRAEEPSELSLAPDATRLLVAINGIAAVSLVSIRVSDGVISSDLIRFERHEAWSRPSWGKSNRSVLYQHDNAVWEVVAGKTRRLFDLERE